MPKASPIYTNFNSGELSPLIEGRSELDQYSKGGKDYKNGICLQYGPYLGRPGSRYSANTKVDAEISRLLEFVFDSTDGQVVLMGILYFRFFDADGPIGAPLEIAHTYTVTELFDVQYVQSNDVLTLCHGAHKPAKLTRLTSTTWSLADYTFFGNPYLPENTVTTDLLTPSVITAGTAGTLTATGGHTPFLAGHVGTFWKIASLNGSDEQGYVEITGYTSTTVVNMTVIVTLQTATPRSDWAEGAWSSVRGWPKKCWYQGGRLWFGETDTQPNGLWGSKPFIYDNFAPGTGLADDAISELLPSASRLSFITGIRTLLVGTNVGDFVAKVSGTATGLTPESIDLNQQTSWGSEPIQPKLIGSFAYAVQLRGRKLRELAFSFQEDSYRSSDSTAVAEHITQSGIVDMSYQRNPYSVMICVLDNGKIGAMTREPDQEVLGWTPWDTDGTYESVAVIPHPTEDHDMIWAIVNRTIDGTTERHVEYFTSPEIPDRQELCFYVDDGVVYNAYEANTGGTLTLSALTGDGITVTAGSPIFAAGNVGKRIRAIDVTDGTVLGELTITQYNTTTEVLGDVSDLAFTSLTYAAFAWGISVLSVSGLNHLEAKTVALLIDGGTTDDLVVASGAVTIPDTEDGFIIAAGLPFTSRWQNMPIEAGSATGTSQGKKKRVYQCGYKFYRSIGMKAGGDVDNLSELVLRNPDTLFGIAEPMITGLVEPQLFDGTNDYEGHIVIQQDKPLPMCILAVMPLLETYDK